MTKIPLIAFAYTNEISSTAIVKLQEKLFEVLAQEDFWSNLARYGRFFITVLLGTAFTAIRPLGGLLKRPVTAVVVVAALFGLYIFLNATLKGMLGVTQEPLTLEF